MTAFHWRQTRHSCVESRLNFTTDLTTLVRKWKENIRERSSKGNLEKASEKSISGMYNGTHCCMVSKRNENSCVTALIWHYSTG